jgi:hypothetical protein
MKKRFKSFFLMRLFIKKKLFISDSQKLDGIVDLTIAYNQRLKPPTFWQLVCGVGNQSPVKIDVNYIEAKDIPQRDYDEWLRRLWETKEEKLRAFTTNAEFAGDRDCLQAETLWLQIVCIEIFFSLTFAMLVYGLVTVLT